MSGPSARRGFRFQDYYLLKRILDDLAARRSASLAGRQQPSLVTFGVETPLHAQAGTPDWDTLVIGAQTTEVIEAKSGQVTREDRTAFWLRLRSELTSADGGHESIVPVLVTNADKQPSGIQFWHELDSGAADRHIDAVQVLGTHPTGNLNSSEWLVKEALYWLCGATDIQITKGDGTQSVKHLGRVIPQDVASAALKRFRLEETSENNLEQEVETKLDLLTVGPDAAYLRRQLRGWLDDRATSRAGAVKQFSSEDLLREVQVLQRLLAGSPDAFGFARALRQRYTPAFIALCEARATHPGGLCDVPLDGAQPALSQHQWASLINSVIIIGDGGQGKSQALLQLYRKLTALDKLDVVAVGAEALAEHLGQGAAAGAVLSETLQLLADFAALDGHRLTMLVDGMDQVGTDISARLAGILNAASGHPAFKAVITCRRPDWHSSQTLQGHLAGWEQMNLLDWPDTLVDDQLESAGVTRQLTPGLRQLVRNPLYLDLLVRTFGQGVPLPPQLQTRHGLFRAFWDIRVLGDNYQVRWLLLSQGCQIRASNGIWSPSTFDTKQVQALTDLESIGLLVRGNNQGKYDFRHPLLRDFAMAQWALAAASPKAVQEVIQNISSPLHRFGAHRALVEAICEAGESPYASAFGLRAYIGEQPPPDLTDEVADILGELTPSADMDPQVWAADLRVDVASRLIRSAQYHLNFDWLRLVVAWPHNPAWSDQQGWLGIDTLRALVDYGSVATEAVLRGNLASAGNLLASLGKLVREWTAAQRFASEMQQGSTLIGRVIPLVARWQINDSTLQWLGEQLGNDTWHTRLDVLEAIPLLAEGIPREQPAMVTALVGLYRSAIGLPERELDFKPDVWNYPSMDYRAVDWCLVGVPSTGGVSLLNALPEAFLPVTLDMLVATTRGKIAETAKRAQWLLKAMQLNEGAGEALSQADVQAGSSSDIDPKGGLLDDHPDGFWRRIGDDLHNTLLHALKRYMEKWLKHDPDWFVREACPLIRSCRVATVQTLLLHLRLDVSSDPAIATTVRDMLWDRDLYECFDLLYWLDRLLLVEWEGLTKLEKSSVCDAVRATVGTNPFNRVLVGELLSGLPETDLPEDLLALVKEASASGLPPFYGDPRREQATTPPPIAPRPKVTPAVIGTWQPPISQDHMATFYMRCSDLPFNDVPAPSAEQITEAIAATETVLQSMAADVDQLVSHPWALQMLELVLVNVWRFTEAHATEADPILLSAIAEVAVSCVEHSPLPAAEGEIKAFQTRYHSDSWSRSLSLADVSLSLDAMKGRNDLRDRVFNVLATAFRGNNPVAQMVGLLEWRQQHWLRQDAGRLELLEEFLTKHVRSGPVLETSLGLLYALDFQSSDRLVRALLTRDDVMDAHDFCFRLGEYLGIRSLVVLTSGARLPAAALLDELSAQTTQYALLVEPNNAAGLLWGIASGLSSQAKRSVSETHLAKDHAKWLSWVWNQLQQYQSYRKKNRPSDFMLHCLYWLGNSDDPNDNVRERRTWWSELHPLIQTVVRSGSREVVHTALFNLRGQLAATISPPADLLGIVDLFVQRLRALNDPAEFDATRPDNQAWNSWGECARYAAEVVDVVCRRTGLPASDLSRGYTLLQALAAHPIKLQDALRRLSALRSDLETSI